MAIFIYSRDFFLSLSLSHSCEISQLVALNLYHNANYTTDGRRVYLIFSNSDFAVYVLISNRSSDRIVRRDMHDRTKKEKRRLMRDDRNKNKIDISRFTYLRNSNCYIKCQLILLRN